MKKKNLAIFMSVLLAAMFGVSFVVTATTSVGATLIMGTTDSVEFAIDPAQAYDFFGWEIIQNTGCGLFETETGTGDIMPSLAINWSVSGDGLTWNFTLRHGVKFDDETEFNATHVKYSFDRSMAIASPVGPQVNMGYDAIIDSVEVVSKYVVQFNLKIPFAPMLRLMACPASFIVNPTYAPFDQVVYYTEGDARASSPMDLGPYVLTNWTRVAGRDIEMWLEANPNYWRVGYPKTEKIIIQFYSDATALRYAVEGGDPRYEEIDIAFRHLSPIDIEDLKDDPDLKVWEGVGAAIQYMIFQEDPVDTLPQLNSSKIRRALTACLNRSELCDTVFLGQASPLYSILPDGMLGHTEAFSVLGDANYTYAVSELAALGYNETNPLEIELWYESSGHYPSSAEQAAVYKAQFEASGVISVTLHSADWPSYRMNRHEGTMHVFLYGWYPDYIDPDNYAFLYYTWWLNHHYMDYNATNNYIAMKAAYDTARASANESERIDLYAEIDDYAVMDCPVVPLWQGKAWAVTKPNIKGVHLDITQSWRMWYLYSTLEARIYIRADGSIDPDTAPISSLDNVTYTFTANINDSIVVERDNIVVDGAGYTLQGTGSGTGINLTGRSNVTIKNMKIEVFEYGILLEESSNSTISENKIVNNIYGVFLNSSSNNTLSGNNITDNGNNGIWLEGSSNHNSISKNNITNNGIGIELYYSSNNSISGNIITSNYYGIELSLSPNNRLRNNVLADNDVNFVVLGKALSDFINDVDPSNTVDSKKIYYLINQRDFSVPSDAGFVALVNCTNITVENLKPKNNIPNILLAYTQNSTITKNNITNSPDSDLAINIWLINSSSNNLYDNNIEKGQNGIYLSNSSCNNVYGNIITEIADFGGITLSKSSSNNIYANTITNGNGIWLWGSSNNVIVQNNLNLTSDWMCWMINLTGPPVCGGRVMLYRSSNNVIYHNNFVMNRNLLYINDSVNIWDNGYPSGGNYWSNYTDVDLYSGPYQNETGSNGIGDTLYIIDENNHDKYPLMGMFSNFVVTSEYHVQNICNSSISDFQFNGTAICFNVIGENGTGGFCRICIPRALMNETYKVFVNGTEVPCNLLPCSNTTHSYLYFTYNLSTQEVIVIPEFPTWTSMLPILTLLTVAIAIRKRRLLKTPIH
jgi:peptide/nickel transport system substrate-binding protein